MSAFGDLPPRPVKPTEWLNVNETDMAKVAEHRGRMLDYWIAEAQWQEHRANQLNAELSAFLRSQRHHETKALCRHCGGTGFDGDEPCDFCAASGRSETGAEPASQPKGITKMTTEQRQQLETAIWALEDLNNELTEADFNSLGTETQLTLLHAGYAVKEL